MDDTTISTVINWTKSLQ